MAADRDTLTVGRTGSPSGTRTDRLGPVAPLTRADCLHLRPSSNLPFTLVNNYGPTEYTVVATSGVVEPSGSTNLPSMVNFSTMSSCCSLAPNPA